MYRDARIATILTLLVMLAGTSGPLPEMGKRLGASGAVLTGGTAETFADFLRTEINKWAKVVKFAKMRVD